MGCSVAVDMTLRTPDRAPPGCARSVSAAIRVRVDTYGMLSAVDMTLARPTGPASLRSLRFGALRLRVDTAGCCVCQST